MRVERTGQAPEIKTLTRWSRYSAQGDRVTIKFNEPAADRGMGLLIAREPGSTAASQMWLRMPSWPQARRIAGDREARYFGGTDLTFEDNRQLMGEAVADFNYRTIKADAQGWLIEATPKQAGSSGYAKRLIQLSAQRAVVQIQYFDLDGSPLKTQRHEGLLVETTGRWRAGVVLVDNHKEGSRTRLEISKRDLSQAVPERVFNPNFLGDL
ncbi:MAG: outer membrane lipoprotein-sorting protein [Brachymonas sp.]|nr:outer membrane lipoprotein-sorting protein [Brachymonas sp.]